MEALVEPHVRARVCRTRSSRPWGSSPPLKLPARGRAFVMLMPRVTGMAQTARSHEEALLDAGLLSDFIETLVGQPMRSFRRSPRREIRGVARPRDDWPF